MKRMPVYMVSVSHIYEDFIFEEYPTKDLLVKALELHYVNSPDKIKTSELIDAFKSGNSEIPLMKAGSNLACGKWMRNIDYINVSRKYLYASKSGDNSPERIW